LVWVLPCENDDDDGDDDDGSGDTEENVVKLCQHADLSADDRKTIMNMHKLGVPLILEVCLSVCPLCMCTFLVIFCFPG